MDTVLKNWKFKYNSKGFLESYYPDIGEIISYPNRRLGVAIVVQRRGVLFTCLKPSKNITVNGSWDIFPASESEKERFHRERLFDLKDVLFDYTCTNKLPCGVITRRWEKIIEEKRMEEALYRGGEGPFLRS